MPRVIVSALHIYPVKSCAGMARTSVLLDRWGPAGDRRWMAVDSSGRFLTQREHPRMALIRPEPRGAGLCLHAPGKSPIEVAAPRADAGRRVRVWDDDCDALDAGDGAAGWLSSYLGLPCRFVRMDESRHARPQGASFADAYPFLLISEASLEDLNSRMPKPLPMDRFRPNIVVKGCAPYAEDAWRRIRIGKIIFRVVKPCSRCGITTVDQKTAETGPEPLKTLAGYRRQGGQVMFGQNLAHEGQGTLRLEDELTIL